MQSATELDTLWQPVTLGPIRARNRIYLPAHNVSLSPEDYGLYLAERARGGVGLIVAGAYPVNAATARSAHVRPWDPAWAATLAQSLRPAQDLGVPVVAQLFHMGASGIRRTDELQAWGPLVAPSPIPSPVHGGIPKVLEEDEIRALVAAFADTAAGIQAAGGDGVEIHGSHGYLLANFLSPYWNRRGDDWGGDTPRRARIVLEIGRAIRRRCGRGFAVGMKLSLDEYLGAAGMTPEEALRVVALLADAGLFDYLCLSHTDYHAIHRLVPPACSGEDAPLAARSAAVRELLAGRLPLLIQGSVRDLATAAAIVNDGAADMVGLARAHIADPELVNKVRAGHADHVRRCVGANQGCWARIGQSVSCTVNPAAGREREFGVTVVRPAPQRRRVLVIGGGPAGLKFADTAASLGHEVTLWEQAAALGGQLRQAARLPGHSLWSDLVDDLAGSLQRRGVAVELGLQASAADIVRFAADAVVLATGARWNTDGFSTFRVDRDGIPRSAQARVLDPLAAIEAPGQCGQRVVVVDDVGNTVGVGMARLLAARGCEVTLVTADAIIARKLDATLERPWLLPQVAAAGIHVRTSRFVESIEAGNVVLREVQGPATETLAADSVVLCMLRQPEAALSTDLRALGLHPLRIGDCLAPRAVDDAVLEGFREAHSLGS